MKPTSAERIATAINKKSAQVRKAKGPQPLGEAIGYGKVGVIGAIERKGNVVARSSAIWTRRP